MKTDNLPALPKGYTYRLDLARSATPRDLKDRARHRWFYFPHSYSDELLNAILDDWQLAHASHLLDPFVGAGTTMVLARERGLSATGFDLSPLSVLVSNVKAKDYESDTARRRLVEVVRLVKENQVVPEWDAERLKKALSENERKAFWNLREAILLQKPEARDFLLVGLLRIVKDFSRAVANGGWFRWVERIDQGENVLTSFERQVKRMLDDLANSPSLINGQMIEAKEGDARNLRVSDATFDGLITSPPYPNRHDYSRIFHIELLIMGEKESDVVNLRHRSLRSHVEAQKPNGSKASISGYEVPDNLKLVLEKLPPEAKERIIPMLHGYFEDLYASLRVCYQALKSGARAAFVVGNVRYLGILVPVDEILADIGTQVGFSHERTWVIRLRGNSSQQMGRFGRVPSRESVVFLKKER